MAAQAVVVLLGLWLMVAPAVVGFGDPARANDRIVGPITASVGAVAMAEVARGLRWGNVLAGAWLVLAPWVLDHPGWPATATDVATGLAILAVAPLGGRVEQRFAGGWRSLLGAWRPAGAASATTRRAT